MDFGDLRVLNLSKAMNGLFLYYRAQRGYLLNLLSIALFAITTQVGCAGGANVYSKADDVALGEQIVAEIAKNPAEYPILNDARLTSYVQGIVNQIVSSPNVKNKDFHYTVRIVNDSKTVNAFSLPGGPMYVYTGLLNFVDNEATLAGILAHEITHADQRHATEQLTKAYGLEVIAAIALGQNPGALAQIAAQIAGNLTVLKFSRDAEREADAESFKDLMGVPGRPWYPAAIKYFMMKALANEKEQPSKFERLFLTHPPSQERLDNVNAMAKAAGLPEPAQSQLRASEYLAIRSTIPK
jgi:predicted Zn-dependent protease